MKKILGLLLALMLVFSCVSFAEEATLTKDLMVLFTSDAHCGVEDNFGYAGVAAVRDYYAKTNHVILVDCGDAIQGAPVGTMTKGEAVVEVMEAVGYEVATIGNHEFDYGMENFLNIVEEADYEYVSANFNYKGELVLKPYTIKEFDGVKVAFVGVTTPKSFTSSTPTYFQDDEGNYVYGFCEDNDGANLYAAVQEAVDAARAEGAQYVLCMAHLGTEESCQPWTSSELIANTTGIDVLLDGHAHEVEPCSKEKNADGEWILRVACGTKLANIGYAKISASGAISCGLISWNYEGNATEFFGLQGYAVDAVQNATAELNEKLATVVAHTDVDLTIADPETGARLIRNNETNLGDLVADGYRDQAGTDIAMVNGGGIRVTIKAGDITMNNILSVHPFGNSLTVVEATGQQIMDALEWTSHSVPGEFGGFLQVSGLTYEIHTYIPSSCISDDKGNFAGIEGERRVKNIMVNGEPIDPEKTYTVASHDYLLKSGGDGTNCFVNDVVLQDAVKLDNQVLIDYIVDTLGGVVGEEYANPYGEGRIVFVTEP